MNDTIIDPKMTMCSPRPEMAGRDGYQIASTMAGGELVVPEPNVPINVRRATMDDFEFIDALQKQRSDAVGFFHRKTIEGYIERGDCLIAEEGIGEPGAGSRTEPIAGSRIPAPAAPIPLGYCFSRDTYFKREDCGVIYQMNIVPGAQRGLIGATLLKEVFNRAPYGVKLYCCWCAQDLAANHFWEAMGFTPLAFRTGSAKKKGQERMHIFWQKRIRSGDTTTPWWFPSETKGGAIGSGRIVIPIPVGRHWSDPMPVILPGVPERIAIASDDETHPGPSRLTRGERVKRKTRAGTRPPAASIAGALWFGPSPEEIAAEQAAIEKATKKKQRPRKRMKNNPEYVAAARELRDRFLEEVEHRPELLEGQASGGKYDVSRLVDQQAPTSGSVSRTMKLLDAA